MIPDAATEPAPELTDNGQTRIDAVIGPLAIRTQRAASLVRSATESSRPVPVCSTLFLPDRHLIVLGTCSRPVQAKLIADDASNE